MKRFSDIRTHSIRDRLYKIFWRAPRRDNKCPKSHHYFGECSWDDRTIHLFPSKNGLELLDTVLEESFHAAFYDIEDEAVRDWVRDTRRLLTRMGIKVSFSGKKVEDTALNEQ